MMWKSGITSVVWMCILGAALFVPAGTIDWLGGWIFLTEAAECDRNHSSAGKGKGRCTTEVPRAKSHKKLADCHRWVSRNLRCGACLCLYRDNAVRILHSQ
jgi:hypothetical protein